MYNISSTVFSFSVHPPDQQLFTDTMTLVIAHNHLVLKSSKYVVKAACVFWNYSLRYVARNKNEELSFDSSLVLTKTYG